MKSDGGVEVGPAEHVIATPERHVGGAMDDGVYSTQRRRPLWRCAVDQIRQVAEDRLSADPGDEVGGAVRAGERTHLMPRTDKSSDQVLPDETAATRDEDVHLSLHSFYFKSFDIKLYVRC